MKEGNRSEEPAFIIVIGASAGGVASVIELATQLDRTMNAAVFVVLHLAEITTTGLLISRIQNNTVFTCKLAENDEVPRRNHLYLANPDQHLILKPGKVVLGEGATENRWRPSIDVLFRSAATSYNGKTIGVILSGLMNDGVSGLIAIQRCGGTTIVQDPNQAEYPDMPLAVLQNMDPDFCVGLEELGPVLREKTSGGYSDSQHAIPADVKAEAAIAERVATSIGVVKEIGERSEFSCPDCGGGLWEMVNDSIVRYRCYTGHVFNENELLVRQNGALESALWTALRMMEERHYLLHKMHEEENSKGWLKSAGSKLARARELETHIHKLKEILFESEKLSRSPGRSFMT